MFARSWRSPFELLSVFRCLLSSDVLVQAWLKLSSRPGAVKIVTSVRKFYSCRSWRGEREREYEQTRCPQRLHWPAYARPARVDTSESTGLSQIRWDYGVSEETRQNRFLRWRQLPVAYRPVEGPAAACRGTIRREHVSRCQLTSVDHTDASYPRTTNVEQAAKYWGQMPCWSRRIAVRHPPCW